MEDYDKQSLADDIATLRSWIDGCGPGGMVFFGGAGVSTESGIPDFRSTGGLYSQKYPYPPETMVSHSFFEAHPQEFFRFYFDRMIAPEARPNQAHKKLAELERRGVCRAVVTQNIDGLHQAAGLLQYFQGDKLAIVNLSPTSADKSADLCISAKVGEVFGW